MSFTPEFYAAMHQVMQDHSRFGHLADTEMTEEGSLRVVGINRTDTVKMCSLALDEFGAEMIAGGAELSAALLGVIELAIATGVRLERARWENTPHQEVTL